MPSVHVSVKPLLNEPPDTDGDSFSENSRKKEDALIASDLHGFPTGAESADQPPVKSDCQWTAR
jgi:hypothetical protein